MARRRRRNRLQVCSQAAWTGRLQKGQLASKLD